MKGKSKTISDKKNTGTCEKIKYNIFKEKKKTCPKPWNASYLPEGTGEPRIGPTLLGGGRADGNLICASPPYLKFTCKDENSSHFIHSPFNFMSLRTNRNFGFFF